MFCIEIKKNIYGLNNDEGINIYVYFWFFVLILIIVRGIDVLDIFDVCFFVVV